MKILLLISLTILACVSLCECGCNKVVGFTICVEPRLQAGTYNDPFTLAEKYGVLLYVRFTTNDPRQTNVFYPAMRTQGEHCTDPGFVNFCLRWNWRPKEVCFTVFGRTFIPSLQESQIDYGCQTLVGSILEQN